MDDASPQMYSFVVKIWAKEDGRAEGSAWRGSITHVETGDHFYFEQLHRVPRYLRTYVGDL